MNDIDKLTLRLDRLEQLFDELSSQLKLANPPTLNRFTIVKQIVAVHFGITVADIMSTKRTVDVVWPRQVAMWLCCKATHASTTAIGNAFQRDHGTIMHGRDAVSNRMETNAQTKGQIESLLVKVGKALKAPNVAE